MDKVITKNSAVSIGIVITVVGVVAYVVGTFTGLSGVQDTLAAEQKHLGATVQEIKDGYVPRIEIELHLKNINSKLDNLLGKYIN